MPDQYTSKMSNHDRQEKIVTDQTGKELSQIEEDSKDTTT